MSSIAGYTGLYKQPYADTNAYGDSIYIITDMIHQELNMIILTPGAYKDAMQIASRVSYQFINIFVPSMDVLFISDIFRLIIDLQKIKTRVKLIYPDKISTTPVNVLFNVSQITSNYFVGSEIQDFTVEYVLSNNIDEKHKFYDIYITNGNQYFAFCTYIDSKKLNTLMTNEIIFDNIHLSYNSTLYGGLTCRECAKINKIWTPKFRAHSFKCRDEFNYCVESDQIIPGQRVDVTTV